MRRVGLTPFGVEVLPCSGREEGPCEEQGDEDSVWRLDSASRKRSSLITVRCLKPTGNFTGSPGKTLNQLMFNLKGVLLAYSCQIVRTCVLSGSPVTLCHAPTVMRPLVVLSRFSTFNQNSFKHLKTERVYIKTGHRWSMNAKSPLLRSTWSSSSSRWESFSDMWCSSFSACLFFRLWSEMGPSTHSSGNLLLLENTQQALSHRLRIPTPAPPQPCTTLGFSCIWGAFGCPGVYL